MSATAEQFEFKTSSRMDPLRLQTFLRRCEGISTDHLKADIVRHRLQGRSCAMPLSDLVRRLAPAS